jgi:hypothetical protein
MLPERSEDVARLVSEMGVMNRLAIELLESLICFKCGISYAVPKQLLHRRLVEHWDDEEDEATIYCPNGHPNHYSKSEDLRNADKVREENSRLRDEIMRARHLAEQAEAALREAGRPVPTSPTETEVADSWKAPDAWGWLRCPKCKRPYRDPHWLCLHLRRVHRIDHMTGKPIRADQDEK